MRRILVHFVLAGLCGTVGSVRAMTVRELPPTGPQPQIVGPDGAAIQAYGESHALLISASSYLGVARHGWRPLTHTAEELDAVASTLQKQGFAVVRVADPTSTELTQAFRDFIGKYGREKNNRLVFFYSGHGYTSSNDVSYLVPIDALDPVLYEGEFQAKALPIETVQIWAKEIAARHAMFVFDSCFSGSIFATKGSVTKAEPRGSSPSDRYRFFTQSAIKPVRQFIAAGGPDEELPAQSQFVPMFIEALSGRASSNGDGYVTGKEIGTWIEQNLPRFSPGQSPHSDVIRVASLSFGDMIFQPAKITYSPPPPPAPPLSGVPKSPTVSTGTASSASSAPTPAISFPPEEKVTYAADVFFDFDKATLKPEAMAKLDDIVEKLKHVYLEVVIAVGHTDSIGTEEYARKLSVRHAEAVKSYLVSKGVPANRIYTEGKGSAQPVADNKTAEGRAKNRRVEIEVIGTVSR